MGKSKKKEKGLTNSGRYRAQAAYYDDQGRRRVKSFTADTLEEAQYLAMLWKKDHSNAERVLRITTYDATEKYIDMKRAVLSPSTVRNYSKINNHHIGRKPIGQVPVNELNNTMVQIWVSDLAAECSPKTVRNVYMLFKSAVEMFVPEIRFTITLPPKKKLEYYCPSDDDIRTLIDCVREKYGENSDLEIAINLAAFGTLRRGEIAALTTDDIQDNTIHVSKCMVQDEYDAWETKSPKTYSSDRVVELPEFVIEQLKTRSGKVITCTPDNITRRFTERVEAAGIKRFRFHDLRHYSASIMHAIGIPDQYIMARGGWSSDNVMKTVYRNVIDIEAARQTKRINDYFSKEFNG